MSDETNSRELVIGEWGWDQNLSDNNFPDGLSDPSTCRICLGIHTTSQPLYTRCSCACYHDECLLSWIKHRPDLTCEVCGEQFRGINKEERGQLIASFKSFRLIEICIHCTFSFLLWSLMILISRFKDCITNQLYFNENVRCTNFTDIYEYTLTVNILFLLFVVINIITLICFRRETGIDIYKYYWCITDSNSGRFITLNRNNNNSTSQRGIGYGSGINQINNVEDEHSGGGREEGGMEEEGGAEEEGGMEEGGMEEEGGAEEEGGMEEEGENTDDNIDDYGVTINSTINRVLIV